MEKLGRAIAVTAGLLGILGTAFTLLIGGWGISVSAWGLVRVGDYGLGGILFSILVIYCALHSTSPKGMRFALGLLVSALLAGAVGGTLVRLAMWGALAGGFLLIYGIWLRNKMSHGDQNEATSSLGDLEHKEKHRRGESG